MGLESKEGRSEALSASPNAFCLPQPARGNFQNPTILGEGLEAAGGQAAQGGGIPTACLPAKSSLRAWQKGCECSICRER